MPMVVEFPHCGFRVCPSSVRFMAVCATQGPSFPSFVRSLCFFFIVPVSLAPRKLPWGAAVT